MLFYRQTPCRDQRIYFPVQITQHAVVTDGKIGGFGRCPDMEYFLFGLIVAQKLVVTVRVPSFMACLHPLKAYLWVAHVHVYQNEIPAKGPF